MYLDHQEFRENFNRKADQPRKLQTREGNMGSAIELEKDDDRSWSASMMELARFKNFAYKEFEMTAVKNHFCDPR